ncbi:EpsG family protein [Acinetobacter guillouiae]|uniref:EpsG family protein n=1 Tax=Acinetobacter guillouiae TaxID=106649 RepID=UPI003AF7BADB
MLFYYSIWFVISFFSFFSFKKIEVRLLFLGVLIFLCLMTGFRFEVGGDWENYLHIYDWFKGLGFLESLRVTDPSYSFLNYISQQLGLSDTILVNFTCALIFYVSFYFICKKMENYWLLLLISFPYLILVVSMGYTRQSVAIALVILAFKCALENKYWKLILLSILAVSFHKSAITIFMLYPFFLMPIKIFYSKLIFYSYTFFSFLAMSTLIYISSISGENIYTSQSGEVSSAGAIFRIIVHFLPLTFYVFYHSKIKLILKDNFRVFDYLALLIIFTLVMAIPFSTLADRFNLYLIIFDIFVFSTLVVCLNNFNRSVMIGSIIFFNTLMLVIWLSFGAWSHAWLPYQNYITNYLLRVI